MGQENKMRRIESDGMEEKTCVHSQFQQTYAESVSQFQTGRELPFSQPIQNTYYSTVECCDYGMFRKSGHTQYLNYSTYQFKRYATIAEQPGFTDTVQDFWSE